MDRMFRSFPVDSPHVYLRWVAISISQPVIRHGSSVVFVGGTPASSFLWPLCINRQNQIQTHFLKSFRIQEFLPRKSQCSRVTTIKETIFYPICLKSSKQIIVNATTFQCINYLLPIQFAYRNEPFRKFFATRIDFSSNQIERTNHSNRI